jgi:hypothetical protein
VIEVFWPDAICSLTVTEYLPMHAASTVPNAGQDVRLLRTNRSASPFRQSHIIADGSLDNATVTWRSSHASKPGMPTSANLSRRCLARASAVSSVAP